MRLNSNNTQYNLRINSNRRVGNLASHGHTRATPGRKIASLKQPMLHTKTQQSNSVIVGTISSHRPWKSSQFVGRRKKTQAVPPAKPDVPHCLFLAPNLNWFRMLLLRGALFSSSLQPGLSRQPTTEQPRAHCSTESGTLALPGSLHLVPCCPCTGSCWKWAKEAVNERAGGDSKTGPD